MAVGTYALVSLDELKEYAGINSSDHDGLLEKIVNRTTSLFESSTRRKLKARDYSYDPDDAAYDPDNAVLNGNDRDRISLPQYPVNSIATLKVNDMEIDERETIYSCGWVIEDRAAGIVTLSCYIFTKGLKNIELAYNAGFSTVPDDLYEACLEQAAWFFKQSPAGANLLGVAAKNLPDGSISYTTKDLLPYVQRRLNHYKKRFVT